MRTAKKTYSHPWKLFFLFLISGRNWVESHLEFAPRQRKGEGFSVFSAARKWISSEKKNEKLSERKSNRGKANKLFLLSLSSLDSQSRTEKSFAQPKVCSTALSSSSSFSCPKVFNLIHFTKVFILSKIKLISPDEKRRALRKILHSSSSSSSAAAGEILCYNTHMKREKAGVISPPGDRREGWGTCVPPPWGHIKRGTGGGLSIAGFYPLFWPPLCFRLLLFFLSRLCLPICSRA